MSTQYLVVDTEYAPGAVAIQHYDAGGDLSSTHNLGSVYIIDPATRLANAAELLSADWRIVGHWSAVDGGYDIPIERVEG